MERDRHPGLFLAGEVRGLALVRNAIGQGRKVVERIAERVADLPPAPEGTADVIIVGAGPAGLSAALAATERGLSFIVLEQEADLGGSLLHYPRRKMVLLQPVDLPMHGRLHKEEYQKEDFLELMDEPREGAPAEHQVRAEGDRRAAHRGRLLRGRHRRRHALGARGDPGRGTARDAAQAGRPRRGASRR